MSHTTARISSFVTMLAILILALQPASSFAVPVTWDGNDGTDPTFWDITTTSNWAGPTTYTAGDDVTFDDTGTGLIVDLQANLFPGTFALSASTNAYTFNSGNISGGTSIVKTGTALATFTQEDLGFIGALASVAEQPRSQRSHLLLPAASATISAPVRLRSMVLAPGSITTPATRPTY